ncbi:MAG: preprotein translocase subunit YajC [Synergistes sp.]|nr:preprotein translocase subunit YajC [Synergistes sp.]
MGGQQGSLTGMLLPLAMFAAIFYFMIIRPQKKKQKAHDDMLASISKGDTVITAGGFFGVVREVLDDSYLIELDEGVKVRILKSSISMKKSDMSSAPQQPKKKKSKKEELPAGEPVREEEPVSEEAVPEEAVPDSEEKA